MISQKYSVHLDSLVPVTQSNCFSASSEASQGQAERLSCTWNIHVRLL